MLIWEKHGKELTGRHFFSVWMSQLMQPWVKTVNDYLKEGIARLQHECWSLGERGSERERWLECVRFPFWLVKCSISWWGFPFFDGQVTSKFVPATSKDPSHPGPAEDCAVRGGCCWRGGFQGWIITKITYNHHWSAGHHHWFGKKGLNKGI